VCSALCSAFVSLSPPTRRILRPGYQLRIFQNRPRLDLQRPWRNPVNLKARVIMLYYHRFEDNPKDSLALKLADSRRKCRRSEITASPSFPWMISRRGGAEKNVFRKNRPLLPSMWIPFRVQSGVADSQKIRLSLYRVHLHGLHEGRTEIWRAIHKLESTRRDARLGRGH
jgi:hypothetical protein